MTRDRLINLSERWFTLLQRLYPRDFREEMGADIVDAYTSRACRDENGWDRAAKLLRQE